MWTATLGILGNKKFGEKKQKNKEQPLVMQHGKLSRHFIYLIAWRSERGMGLVSTYVWRRSWPEFHDNSFISLAGEERFSWWRSREQRDSLILGKMSVWLLWERWSSTGPKDHLPRRGLLMGPARSHDEAWKSHMIKKLEQALALGTGINISS